MTVSEVLHANVAALSELTLLPEQLAPAAAEKTTTLSPTEIERQVLALYEQVASQLFRYACALGHQRDAAQEVVQEVFLRYYVALVDGAKIENGKAWLFRATRNLVLDQRKSYVARNCVSLERTRADEVADGRPGPEQERLCSEVSGYALRLLSPRELECLQLRAEGLNYREIAQTLNVGSGTVGTMLLRGLKKIRQAVGV